MSESKLHIITDKKDELKKALEVFSLKLSGFKIADNKLAIYDKFLFHESESKKGMEKFPYPLQTSEALATFIIGWIQSGVEFPQEPDCDGSICKGVEAIIINNSGMAYFEDEDEYKLYESDKLGNRWDVRILVRPAWLEYHK